MAKSIDHLVEPTPKGVKIDLKTLYVYEDGHANLTFAKRDGEEVNWPMADPYEVVQILAGELLRPMQKRARVEARNRREAALKAQASRTPEQRSEAARKANASRTREQRQAAAAKAAATRRADGAR